MQLDRPLQVDERDSGLGRIVISGELVAYTALLVFALVLRLAELDTTPMMLSETHNALAAWRVIMPHAPGEALVSSSPILFALQSLSFALFGGSEITARLMTALGGAALILTPILFRPLLGRTRAFLISLLLAFSPVLLLASRASSPDVWALLVAALGLWAFWQAGRTEQKAYPVLAVVMFAALIFLAGAGGLALAVILAGAGVLTTLWRRNTFVMNEDETSDKAIPAVRRSLGLALPLAALTVLAISTGLMLYPAGLSAVGEGIGGAIRAIVQPRGISGYPALIALYYEPVLWLLAILGLIIRRERLAAADLFLAAWAALAVIAALFFGDGSPDHALVLTVPLAGLAVNALVWMLSTEENLDVEPFAPRWARWMIAGCTIGVLAVFTLAFHSMARSLIEAPPGGLMLVSPQPQSIVLLLVSVMFLVIGFFLFASLWGGRTSWQGIGLGLAIFGMITSLGSGWNASVVSAQNPAEFWHTEATHSDTVLLRETLFEVADRLTGGFPLMPITVIAPQDGAIAWLLRDFEQATYVTALDDATNAEVVLIPTSIQSPQLEAGYIGQDFTVSRSWDASTMNLLDFPAWWTQRRARSPWTDADVVALWLRQDVYLGIDQAAG